MCERRGGGGGGCTRGKEVCVCGQRCFRFDGTSVQDRSQIDLFRKKISSFLRVLSRRGRSTVGHRLTSDVSEPGHRTTSGQGQLACAIRPAGAASLVNLLLVNFPHTSGVWVASLTC